MVLAFWSSRVDRSVADVPEPKALHERFGEDERFAMLGLCVDPDGDAARTLVAERGLDWPQGFLGDSRKEPDGRV